MQHNAMVASAVCKNTSYDISGKNGGDIIGRFRNVAIGLITTIFNHAGRWIGPNLFIKVEKIF